MSTRHTFSYRNAGMNKDVDNMVAAFSALCDASLDKNYPQDKYQEENKIFSESIAKYSIEAAGREYTGLDMLKNPQFTMNTAFKDTFASVLAQVITPVVPKLISNTYNELYDVRQVGFGDNAIYRVNSNELFIVNDGAEGIARGGIQTIANNEYSVSASKKEITTGVDWYHVAAGKQDWGIFGVKIALSYANYLTASVIKKLTSVVSSAEERTKRGIAGYYAAGMSDANWLTLKRNVSLVNGGAPVYALGTEIGLTDVMPKADTGFRYGEKDQLVVEGILQRYKGVPLMVIDQAINPYSINGTPTALVDDKYIYFVALGGDKPVKVVFEGNMVTVQQDPLNTTDETFGMTVTMRLGSEVIVGNKFGILQKN